MIEERGWGLARETTWGGLGAGVGLWGVREVRDQFCSCCDETFIFLVKAKGNSAGNQAWTLLLASQCGTSVGGFACFPPSHWQRGPLPKHQQSSLNPVGEAGGRESEPVGARPAK